jgi:hypothetical protein
MANRLEEALESHLGSLRSSLEMMQSGWLRTHHNGDDTTNESISQTMRWIDDLERALQRHRRSGA